ncbi:MAG TPA: tRNA (guanosine(46)-N7)-methyltransferase TrmB [Bacteroidales bacterium]|nr:tRNA (guanosine(46)-N7)-methyltransferase TrmB [Bacteroidales bacterium]
MGKNKLTRFRENEKFPHVIQPEYEALLNDQVDVKGNWQKFFGNNHPIILELGCGKGEYTVGLAKRYPQSNYIGIDIKGARIWRGAKTSNDTGMKNVAFLRIRIDFIHHCFDKNEVDEIWCTFSDPHREKRKGINKRLTSPKFLNRYQKILKDNGIVHLKTDDPILYAYTLDVIEKNDLPLIHDIPNIYDGNHSDVVPPIKTHYEKKWLEEDRIIRYISFRLPSNLPLKAPAVNEKREGFIK